MKIVSMGYTNTTGFTDPEAWLHRISFYTGILEELATQHKVESIEQISFNGELKLNGVLYHFLNYKKQKQHFPVKLHKHIKKITPDVVFVNGFIFPLQIIQLRLKLGRAVKIIVIHRSEKPFNGAKKYLQKLASQCVNAFLFTSSEFGKQWITNGNIDNLKKIHEAMHGSSIFKPGDRFAARSALSVTGSLIFLWVGRLDVNKDPLTVVKAFINFLPFQPSAKLYMIYHTQELLQEINDLIKKDIVAKQAISLVGKVPHQQLQAWYSAADFIISGSHYEGGGIAVCEAMSCGCIPIVTNILSFRRMTGPGKCGLLFEAGNENGLLAALLNTKEMNLESERSKTLKQFKDELSFQAIAQKINKIIVTLF
jgi:glycosyltransferase involved in cell wall biosynthesis